jgi:large subunit ribosomal protein L1
VAAIAELMRAKPSSVKGTYIKTMAVSSTMSPSVKIALSDLATLGK